MKERAQRLVEAETKRELDAKAAKERKDQEVRDKLAPRVAALGADLVELRKIDSSPIKMLAEKPARPTWLATTRDRWWRMVQSPARELLQLINNDRSRFPELIREAGAVIDTGWQPRGDFELHVNTLLQDLGRGIGRAEEVKKRMAELSAAAGSFEHLLNVDHIAPEDVVIDKERETIRQHRALMLGKGSVGRDQALDMVTGPLVSREQVTAEGVVSGTSGRPRI